MIRNLGQRNLCLFFLFPSYNVSFRGHISNTPLLETRPALSLRRRIPYLSANRLEPRINRDQHIQTCQFKTTNVKIHPAVPKVYTHLISFGQMEMANASGNFGNTLMGLKAWNDTIHDFHRSNRKNYIFSDRKKKQRFFGHL